MVVILLSLALFLVLLGLVQDQAIYVGRFIAPMSCIDALRCMPIAA